MLDSRSLFILHPAAYLLSSELQFLPSGDPVSDGLSAQVQFSGIAPGFVGLNQINVVVPGLARTNAADPVVLSIGGVPANTVSLPVGSPN